MVNSRAKALILLLPNIGPLTKKTYNNERKFVINIVLRVFINLNVILNNKIF